MSALARIIKPAATNRAAAIRIEDMATISRLQMEAMGRDRERHFHQRATDDLKRICPHFCDAAGDRLP